jgi:hypothetical protein
MILACGMTENDERINEVVGYFHFKVAHYRLTIFGKTDLSAMRVGGLLVLTSDNVHFTVYPDDQGLQASRP